MSSRQTATEVNVSIEQLQEEDLAQADHIFRLAFGTFLGLPDPAQFHQGAEFIHSRWSTDPAATFAAKVQGKLAGTKFRDELGQCGVLWPTDCPS